MEKCKFTNKECPTPKKECLKCISNRKSKRKLPQTKNIKINKEE